jgi:hypothetical protein
VLETLFEGIARLVAMVPVTSNTSLESLTHTDPLVRRARRRPVGKVATRKYSPESHRRHLNWTEVFAADVRSLAALRVVLTLTVLVDLITRATTLRVHYTDEGILPRRVLVDQLDRW